MTGPPPDLARALALVLYVNHAIPGADEVADTIVRSGLAALSPDQKEILKQMSDAVAPARPEAAQVVRDAL